MLSIDRTPLSTRLLNGHDTNCRFGSSRTASIDGSARRTYLAAVAPPHPPPITTTRRPVFWAKSETVGAQPAASSASPVPEVRRNSLRVDAFIRPSPDCVRTTPLGHAEPAGRLVPGRQHSPPERDRDDQHDGTGPAERRRQKNRRAELLQKPGLHRAEPHERRAPRKPRNGDPELHLSLTGSPERAGATAARECHPDAERETAGERAEPHSRKHPLALVLEVGVFQDGESQRRHDER